MSTSPVLIIQKNGESAKSYPLDGEMTIGRGESCQIRLDDRAVSRLHAVFRIVTDGVRVEKKSSFTPLLLNGVECVESLLKEGDVLSIGPYSIRIAFQTVSEQSLEPLVGVTVSASGESVVSPDQNAAPLSDIQSFDPPIPDPPIEPAIEEKQSVNSPEIEGFDNDAATRVLSENRLKARLIFPKGSANVTEYEIQKDEITIGRGKDCDVVIHEKKSSRQHVMIRREGINFTIKDLGSGNGTFVNNLQITEQPLTSDDVIRIGDLEFNLEILDEVYLEMEKDFPVESLESMQLPEDGLQLENEVAQLHETHQTEPIEQIVPPISQPSGFTAGMGIPGIAEPEKAAPQGVRGYYIKYIRNFKTLETRQKVVVAAMVVGLFALLFFDDEEESVNTKKSNRKVASAAVSPAPVKEGNALLGLTEDQKRDLEAWHNLAFDYYKNREYDKSIFEIKKIFQLVPDYKDAKEIERYAFEGKRKLEALEEERKKKEEEAELRLRIQKLVEEAQEKLDAKNYEELKDIISQILAQEPDNSEVSKFRSEIRAYEDSIRQAEELKRVQAEINGQLMDKFASAMALKKEGKCYSAIEEFRRVLEGLQEGYLNPKLKARSLAMIRSCKASIVKRREPVLKEAEAREAAGEYFKALELYRKLIRIDSHHPAGYAGVNRVSGYLHEKAKAAYTEGVLAESYSDFVTSKKKFQECMEIAPKEDIYYQRAQSKLSRYFKQGDQEGSTP